MMALRPRAPAPMARAWAQRTWTLLQEVQILTAAYAAEYGRTSGRRSASSRSPAAPSFMAQLTNIFVTTSSTRIPGHVTRPPARDFVPPFRYNQYGFNVGGPFYIPGKFNRDKNKYFWYWGQEWVNYRFTDTADLDRSYGPHASR